MKRMVISLVIEAFESGDLHTIKGNIIDACATALISCQVNELEEPSKELQLAGFVAKRNAK